MRGGAAKQDKICPPASTALVLDCGTLGLCRAGGGLYVMAPDVEQTAYSYKLEHGTWKQLGITYAGVPALLRRGGAKMQ